MPLTGTLQDLSLPSLIQLQCGEQRPAQVRLVRRGREGLLGFANGELTFARLGAKTGEPAIYEMIAWEDAEFFVNYNVDPLEQNVFTPWSALLLEAMRRLDEARAERNPAFEEIAMKLVGQRGVLAAVVCSQTNPLNAAATDPKRLQDTEWISELATQAQSIGDLLDLDQFEQMVSAHANEKIWIQVLEDAYIGGWLDTKATVEPLRALIHPPSEGKRKDSGTA